MNTPTPNDARPPPAPRRDDDDGLPTWAKALLWTVGILVGLPLVGVLLLFGYCAVAGR